MTALERAFIELNELRFCLLKRSETGTADDVERILKILRAHRIELSDRQLDEIRRLGT